MTFIITVTGKGGTGKTLIATLIVKHLTRMFKDASILVVDADSNTNLNNALGIHFKKTLGDLREEFMSPSDSSSGARDLYFESILYEEVLVESEYFDFIAMGRPEGPGCYCYVNHLLRHALDKLTKNYDFVVIDCEAGLEHLSRRTTRNIDVMLVAVDSSIRSIVTAERIRELSKELELSVKNIYVIINRVDRSILPRLLEELLRRDFKIIGSIPEDPLVIEYDFRGEPLINLSEDSLAVKSVGDILSRLYPFIKSML